MRTLPVLLTLLFAAQSQAMEPQHGRDFMPMPPPMAVYQASQLTSNPQATAESLTKLVPAAEQGKRYEVLVSVRELPVMLPLAPEKETTKEKK